MRWAHSAVDYLAAAVGGDRGAGGQELDGGQFMRVPCAGSFGD